MKAALYLRRSTNERLQSDSLRAQEQILRGYARSHDMQIVSIYSDSASGTIARRPGFERMVKAITHGAEFEVVLCRDVSRFGRFFDVDEGAFFETLFVGHGVKTVYAEEVFGTEVSPMAGLIKGIRRVMASEYSRDKSRLVRYGQARTATLGFHACGPAPFGLRRVMVNGSGEHVADLRKGEWKALQNHRVKLTPGDDNDIGVVRLIFEQYADGIGTVKLAQDLNDRRIPSPHGKRWYAPTVMAILNNPVYVGSAHYHVRKKKGLSDPPIAEGMRDVVTEGCYDAVIDNRTWERVSDRLSKQTHRRTDEQLAAELRLAYERHGSIEVRMLEKSQGHASWPTYAGRFPDGIDGALEVAYDEVVQRERANFTKVVGDLVDDERFSATGSISLFSATVSVRPVFLHQHRHGVMWLFDPHRFIADVCIAFGIGREGSVTRWLVTRGVASQKGAKGRYCGAHEGAGRGIQRVDDDDLAVRIRTLARYCGSAISHLTELLQSMRTANLVELSRTLGWPYEQTRRLYWKMRADGIYVPPLLKHDGRTVAVTCAKCGKTRLASLTAALSLRSQYCFSCMTERGSNKVPIKCPSCGREALRWPSAVNQLQHGAATVCRACRSKKNGVPQ